MRKKRSGPEPVRPVSHNGVRYEAVHWGKLRDLGQNGGYLAAIDETTGGEHWLLKVYDVVYDDDREPDKQDVFIAGLFLERGSRALIIENERGRRYRVDLESRKIDAL